MPAIGDQRCDPSELVVDESELEFDDESNKN